MKRVISKWKIITEYLRFKSVLPSVLQKALKVLLRSLDYVIEKIIRAKQMLKK